MKRSAIRLKSDECILGDGDFVSEIFGRVEESFERRAALKVGGLDMDYGAERVAFLLNIADCDLWCEGRRRGLVRAGSLLCFRAVRELAVSMTAPARRLNISTVAVSKSVARGAEMAKRDGRELI